MSALKSKNLGTIFFIFSIVMSILLGFFYGKSTSYSSQLTIIESLRQVSILIFGVIGAWITVLFPFINDTNTRHKEAERIKKLLFTPFSWALYIIIYTLLIPLIASVASQNLFCLEHKEILRAISFGILSAATCFQIYTLILALRPFDVAKTLFDLKAAEREVQRRVRENIKKA